VTEKTKYRIGTIVGWTIIIGLEVGWVLFLIYFHDRLFVE